MLLRLGVMGLAQAARVNAVWENKHVHRMRWLGWTILDSAHSIWFLTKVVAQHQLSVHSNYYSSTSLFKLLVIGEYHFVFVLRVWFESRRVQHKHIQLNRALHVHHVQGSPRARCKNLSYFFFATLARAGFGYCWLVFCFLCFTSPVSMTGSYNEDEL